MLKRLSSLIRSGVRLSCLLLALSACRVSAPAAPRTPLSQVNLESIILLPGDLPETQMDSVSHKPPEDLIDLPPWADLELAKLRSHPDPSLYPIDIVSSILIIVYQDPAKSTQAYEQLLKAVYTKFEKTKEPNDPYRGSGPLAEVGERGMFFNQGYGSVDVLFTRCQTVVRMNLGSPALDADLAAWYAGRLDKRLQPLVCK